MSELSLGVRDSESFVRALLGSRDMSELARAASGHLSGLGCQWTQLVWNSERDDESTSQAWPPGIVAGVMASLLARCRQPGDKFEQVGTDGGSVKGACLLSRTAHISASLLYRRSSGSTERDSDDSAWSRALNLLALRCESLLQTEQLRVDVKRLARAERVQAALFAISDCASSSRDTTDALRELHQIVGRLMYAKNFFIVRYTVEPETIRFLYFADSSDATTVNPGEAIDASHFANSLTLACLAQRGLAGRTDD